MQSCYFLDWFFCFLFFVLFLFICFFFFFFCQAEDGIRDLVRSRGLGDVYKRQIQIPTLDFLAILPQLVLVGMALLILMAEVTLLRNCLLYTSDAADERSSVDLGGRRIIKKKTSRCNW